MTGDGSKMQEVRKRWQEHGQPLAEKAQNVLILGHVHPDGDCVGACLGLYHLLTGLYPEKGVQVVLEAFPEEFALLSGVDKVSHDFSAEWPAELVICVDAAGPERLGDGKRFLDAAEHSICIDHHATNRGFAEVDIIKGGCSSASEMVAHLVSMEEISLAAAECLYLGIAHDTGLFRFSSTTEETMRTAGAFLSKGVNAARIIDETYFQKSFIQNKALGYGLLQARLLEGGCVVGSVMTLEDQKKLGAGRNDMDSIIDQLRLTRDVEMAAFLYETEPGMFKISLRSNHVVDVSRIAAEYGGGGHRMAAGGRTEKDPWQVLDELAACAARQMRLSGAPGETD